ncbi:hypothetical protein ACH4ZX_33965 [Streptomyces sp. NPDC020490]|uniref:hypothetical protein n=1 Tax=Streptomyces sp. NPDC020490 TaxID=3365078 RepID=UPI0037A99CA4
MSSKRLLAAIAVSAATLVVPVAIATPASADQSRCVNYIGDQGYIVGPKVKAACSHSPLIPGSPNPNCYVGLVNLGVRNAHAMTACLRA